MAQNAGASSVAVTYGAAKKEDLSENESAISVRLSRRVKKVFKVVKMEEKIAKDFLAARNYADKILIMKDSTATVDLAAQALGCEPARIAKTLSFDVREKTVMLVCAGTAKSR